MQTDNSSPRDGVTRSTLAWLLLAAVVAGAVVAVFALRQRPASLLVDHDDASWVVYPLPLRAGIRPAIELSTRFTRELQLDVVPPRAVLELRAFRRAELRVNDVAVSVAAEDDWMRSRRVPLAALLRSGSNRIEVTVFNDTGPPAMWMALQAGETRLVSDDSWDSSIEGATTGPARFASRAHDVTSVDPAVATVRPWIGLRECGGWLLVYGGLALVALLAVRGLRRYAADAGAGWVWGLFALAAGAWLVLFVNDAPSLWAGDGYDAHGHLDYIRFILDQGRLPLATDGWSMFHPPLYYATSAGLLKIAGLVPLDPAGVFLLRVQGAVFGVGLLAFVLAGLREIFAGRPTEQIAGLLVAAALPVHLHMYMFVANDGLAATLSAAAVWCALRALRRGSLSPLGGLALGGLLGGALLAKSTALIPLAVIPAVLVIATWRRRGRARQWLAGLAAALAALLVTCGWHYLRVWWRFGRPLVGNWDAVAGDPWWQDPGYLTPAFYLRFGTTLDQPLLSGVNGLIDGIYSTMWGEALLAGYTGLSNAPPWNLEALAAGYLLALIPTALAAVGVVSLIRQSRPGSWLILVLAAATAAALALWPLKLPAYSVIKASFAMPAALAWCALIAAGFGAVAGWRRWAAWVVSIALCVWAANAYAAHWIPRGDPRVDARLGMLYAYGGSLELAATHLQRALSADPGSVMARLGTGSLASARGDAAAAESQLRQLVREHPADAHGHEALARTLERAGRLPEALEHYRRAAGLRPSLAGAQLGAGRVLLNLGRTEEAELPLRAAIALVPEQSREIRQALEHAKILARPPAMPRE